MKELRFIVTLKCNANCSFCHREGCKDNSSPTLLSPSDYGFVFEIVKKRYGFNTCTLTGGEPTLRKDLKDILECLKSKGAKITLVTNGTSLNKQILNFLSEVHISLPVLDKEKYTKITGLNSLHFQKVKRNIIKAKKYLGGKKVKINMCFLKNINDSFSEVLKMIKFCLSNGFSLRMIELLKPYDNGYFTPISLTNSWLEWVGIEKIRTHPLRSRERIYYLHNGLKVSQIIYLCNYRFQFTKSELEKRCKEFMDFFITPDGKIKICFLNDRVFPVLQKVKQRDEKGLVRIFESAYKNIGKKCSRRKGFDEKEYKMYKQHFMEKKYFQIPTVYCIVIKNKRVLLLRRKDIDVFEFPGGSPNFFETLEQTAKREVKEETGISLKEIKLFHTSAVSYPNNFVQQLLIFFLGTPSLLPKRISLSAEHIEYRWIPVKKLDKLPKLALSAKTVVPRLVEYVKKSSKVCRL